MCSKFCWRVSSAEKVKICAYAFLCLLMKFLALLHRPSQTLLRRYMRGCVAQHFLDEIFIFCGQIPSVRKQHSNIAILLMRAHDIERSKASVVRR